MGEDASHNAFKQGGFTIKRNKTTTLGEIVFEGCKTQFYERPDSFLASFQMEEFRIEDNTDTSLYKHIVSVKQDEENHQGDSFEKPFCSYRLKTIHWIKKQTQFLLEN